MFFQHRILIVLASSFFALLPVLPAQTGARPALPELWTALEGKLDATKLNVGDTVSVRTLANWVYQTCGLEQNTLLRARVTAVRAFDPALKSATLALAFAAPCMDGSRQPLVLMAVFYPDEAAKSQMDVFNAMPQGIGAGASGRQSTDIGRLPSPDPQPPAAMPLAKWGEVWRISHLSLEFNKGPEASTQFVTTEKKLRLNPATRLVLVPVPVAR